MKKTTTALLAACFASIAFVGAAHSAEPQLRAPGGEKSSLAQLIVTAVAAKSDKGDEAIRFEVENKGIAEIELFRDMLPWKTRSSMVMTLIPLRQGGAPLDQVHLIDDPGPTPIKLGAGERLTGTVPLSECFSEYKRVTGKSDFVVFWSWQVLEAGGASRRYVGTVEFSAAGR